MENAAKALLIAGGVLIAILLLTLFSYLITKMDENTSGIYEMLDAPEISKFNQQFLIYEGRGINVVGYEKKDDGSIDKNKPLYNPLTAQDVATLINLVQDNNKNPKFSTTINVTIDNDDVTEISVLAFLNENASKKYKCDEIHINGDTLLVDRITLTTIN